MPYTAYHPDTEDIHFAAQADPESTYLCIDCKEGVQFVRSHTRDLPSAGETRVSPHFRYSNCAHGTVSTVSEGSGGGGGGGGSGESELHKRRKRAALQEALERFPSADYGTEVTIGDKRADALLDFEEPHEEYGKGLVIEYQHKNEGKDIPATQQHFAKHEYTTVWLWEEQFTFSSSIPDINLFGGEVYTPWPDAVPPMEQWSGLGHAQEKQAKWRQAHRRGLTNVVVEAEIVKDWVVKTPKEHWSETDWKERFPDENNPSERDYRLQVAIGSDPSSISVPATIPADWFWPTPKEYWEQQHWSNRFRYSNIDWRYRYTGSERLREIYWGDSDEWSLQADIPIFQWVLEEGRDTGLLAKLRSAYHDGVAKREGKLPKQCPHCDHNELHRPIADGEIARGSTCSSCGEPYTVFDRRSGQTTS